MQHDQGATLRPAHAHEFTTKSNHSVVTLLAGVVALCTSFACGAATEFDAEENVEAQESELKGENDLEFKYLSAQPALANATGDATMCTPLSITHSKVTFLRNTTGYINGFADVGGIRGPWGKYGGDLALRKFGGDPACGFLPGTTNPFPFILVAKGSKNPTGGDDKRLFWSKGEWQQQNAVAPTTSLTAWAQITGTSFEVNGNPAVATRSNQLVVVYLTDGGQLMAHYWKTADDTFSAAVAGPSMPQGWTAIGTPAIAYVGSWLGKYMIVARARNADSTSYRLYATYFNGTQFKDASGGPNIVFERILLGANSPTVDSDPALEYDTELPGTTLYYRSNKKIYQTSTDVNYFGASTTYPFRTGDVVPDLAGNPSVIGGISYEGGNHWIEIRGTNGTLYFGESYAPTHLVR